MHIPRAGGSARLGGRGWRGRIRFREAVPVRRDRSDLRRRFRRAARATVAEQKAEMTALLHQLSDRREPLAEITPGPRGRDGVIEFRDGTRLLLATGHGAAMKRLSGQGGAARATVWLVRAQPSFTRRRFRLWFASAGGALPAEVVAAVRAAPEASPPADRS
ncbi:MAG: hypothetical protein ACRDNW_07870 [Trebonia sp.]